MKAQEVLGRGVAAIRKERGLTQIALAERAEISVQFLSAIELGKKAPSFETVDVFVRVLRVRPEELFARGASGGKVDASADVAVHHLVATLSGDDPGAFLGLLRAVANFASPKRSSEARRSKAPAPSRGRASKRRA